MPTGLAIANSNYTGKSILAIAILPNAKLAQGGMSLTYKEVFEQMGVNYDSYTRLTKEEFYDLTAPTE